MIQAPQLLIKSINTERIGDAFINGLLSNNIQKRLFESKTSDLESAFDQARSLDITQQSLNAYTQPLTTEISAAISSNKQPSPPHNAMGAVVAIAPKAKALNQTFWFCRNSKLQDAMSS